MSSQLSLPSLFFEDFELRVDSGELFKGGELVKLQPQPAKVLELLASRSGEVVSREEIRETVWGESYVDFDASLNFCVKEIRRALGDSATAPHFVETVPRRGYRFLIPVRTNEEPAPEPQSAPPVPLSPRRRWSMMGGVATALILLTLTTLLVASRLHPRSSKTSASEKANVAYAKGIFLRGREDFAGADAKFRDAILLDPDFAAAHAELALNQLQWIDKPVDPEVTEASARRAVELDPDLAAGHAALGQILLMRRLDWEQAGKELRKALDLDPRSAESHFAYSRYLQALGRNQEAIAEVQRARDLDPARMMVGANYAWYLYLDHRYDDAIQEAREILALLPRASGITPGENRQGELIALDTILSSAVMKGDQKTALQTTRDFTAAYGLPELAARIQTLDDFWQGRQQRIDAATRTMAIDPYMPAKNAIVMGDRERALDLLTHCVNENTMAFPFAAVEPLFEPLHDDPRWPKVLDCLKLPADAPARNR